MEYIVKNRSAAEVIYRIPQGNVRRQFQPGQSMRIPEEELKDLLYQPGGPEILTHFLQVQNDAALQKLNMNVEPEYYMSEQQVVDLLRSGSLDAFLDCLEYAPLGVIDLIKKYAVALPLEDTYKKKALKEKTGFDLDAALRHIEEERKEMNEAMAPTDGASASPAPAAPTGRRTNVVYKTVEPAPVEEPVDVEPETPTTPTSAVKYKIIT